MNKPNHIITPTSTQHLKSTMQRLNKIADKLPKCFIEYKDIVMMNGNDLYLTPAWVTGMLLEVEYPIEIPKYVSVNHKHQVKDAFKRDGWRGVDLYSLEVLCECGCLEGVNVVKMILEKNLGTQPTDEQINAYVKPVYEQGGIKGIITGLQGIKKELKK